MHLRQNCPAYSKFVSYTKDVPLSESFSAHSEFVRHCHTKDVHHSDTATTRAASPSTQSSASSDTSDQEHLPPSFYSMFFRVVPHNAEVVLYDKDLPVKSMERLDYDEQCLWKELHSEEAGGYRKEHYTRHLAAWRSFQHENKASSQATTEPAPSHVGGFH